MSAFVRCNWRADESAEVEDRVKQVGQAIERSASGPLLGSSWFQLGRSRKEALSKSVDLRRLSEVRGWRKTRFVGDTYWLQVNLWNGQDGVDGLNLSGRLFLPPRKLDSLVLSSVEEESLSSGARSWDDVLAVAKEWAVTLGGVTVVSSTELLRQAEQLSVPDHGYAAYAVYRGRGEEAFVEVPSANERGGRPLPDIPRLRQVIEAHRAWTASLAGD